MAAVRQGLGGGARPQRINAIIALLERGLKLIDETGEMTAIGAKLQGIIDELRDGR